MTDAKPRTCRECRHYKPANIKAKNVTWFECDAPVPPWVTGVDRDIYDHNCSQAQSCPCYSPKEPTP